MQIAPQINYIFCNNLNEEYKMYYTTWGKAEDAKNTLICLHCLSHNSRDWDYVGNYFANLGYYVVAPDMLGSGNSDYLKNIEGYNIQFFVKDILRLISILNLMNLSLIGTSLGGLIGLSIASMPNCPLNKLILNDIGPEIELSGLNRIENSFQNNFNFESFFETKTSYIDLNSHYGKLPDVVWDSIVRNSFQKNALNKFELKYDSNITKVLFSNVTDKQNVDLWSYWNQVKVPTMVIRGQNSDFLSVKTTTKMKEIHASTKIVELPDAGHAPFLYSREHMEILSKFLVF